MMLLMGVVAFLYASVGHGGASGYLAVLSLYQVPHAEMASTALILNVLVAGLSFYMYRRAGYFEWRLTWPFIIVSIPMAFLGGFWSVSSYVYKILLGFTLLMAAWRLATVKPETSDSVPLMHPPLPWCLISGGLIGWISGLVGVGGGIFLSPLMLLLRWGNAKQVAATSALFIVVNALAGLLGRWGASQLMVGDIWPLLVAAFMGGLWGAYRGAHQFSFPLVRRMLALVLVLAALKLFWLS